MIEQSIVHLPELVRDIERPVSIYLVHLSSVVSELPPRGRWSICLRASALLCSWSKASRVLLGREDLAPRASPGPSIVELMDGVAHRLLAAAEAVGDPRGMLAPRTRQQDLGSAQGESVFGAQRGFGGLDAPHLRTNLQRDWSFHGPYCNSHHETYLDDALGTCVLTGMRTVGSLTNRRRYCASCRPTTEQAATQESTFQGSVTVNASAAEPRYLSSRIEAW